jgi:hypothetical protein
MLRHVSFKLSTFVPGLRQADRRWQRIFHAPAGRLCVISRSRSRTDFISSVHNEYVKHCVKLRESRKYRVTYNTTLLCGLTVITEHFLQSPPAPTKVRSPSDKLPVMMMHPQHYIVLPRGCKLLSRLPRAQHIVPWGCCDIFPASSSMC